ncbi:AbrB family transcriptional regulator [Nesterenkonia alkaliphila]|uniref:AbrB family transcriptional regulator n=1 Tax=Nesterenkonia alkaliphila TaxID=1463631 RepID=A0A7K1UKA9_9MICC|nr:AbrB family transcriptional regulator [Nesterenkonia alkaliphila]MVT26927.1 AbrB family transcriptional regulator [Nesterenkonia alkaliphila]GFZ90575.1 hypothetical protein GCM10011359_20010 [Nesterenkonia alkaliphila]
MGTLLLVAVMAGSVLAALLFRWAKLPLWPLTGGLVGAAAVNLSFGLAVEVPGVVALLAQLVIGAAIGASIGPEIFRHFARIVAPGTLAVVVVLGAGLAFGWLFAALGLLEPAESVFSLMPGGVAEMVAAAVALGYDGAVVIGAHIVRLFTVIWSVPLFLWAAEKIYRRWIQPPETPGP